MFDFGDVFINLDKTAAQRELLKLNTSGFTGSMHERNHAYEKGLLTSEEFISSYLQDFPQLSKEQFKNAWNSVLLDFPEYRLEFLKKLSEEKKYKLILLSNTNDLHIDWVKENVPFFEEFKSCFDAFYLSQEIGMRKPEEEIYEFILSEHEEKAEEILFIDDISHNAQGAAKKGINTWNIDPLREDVVNLFDLKEELF